MRIIRCCHRLFEIESSSHVEQVYRCVVSFKAAFSLPLSLFLRCITTTKAVDFVRSSSSSLLFMYVCINVPQDDKDGM